MDQQGERAIISIDKHQFRDIFNAYFGELCQFAYSFTLDFDVSQDIVQEAYIKFWKIRNNFDETCSIRAWLYKTTRNGCLDHLKSSPTKFNFREQTLELLSRESPPELDSIEINEIKSIIESVLKELPELTSTIFRMNRHEDMTYAEIAEKLNLSTKSIEYHMSKALAKLRIHLKDYLFMAFLLMNGNHTT